MTHMIPVIISVLIANAISQTLDLSIYDSIIQIKKLPFLPPILTTSSSAHHILCSDIAIRDVIFIWRNCTYRDIRQVLNAHQQLTSFPLVDNGSNMILLGSIQRGELIRLAHSRLSRERRLQEVRRRYSIQMDADDALNLTPRSEKSTSGHESLPRDVSLSARKMSRFEVTPVKSTDLRSVSPKQTLKSPKGILKQTVSFTYSPNATVTNLSAQGIHGNDNILDIC